MTKRLTIFAYGLICYLIFLATFLYATGFVGNILVAKSLDSAASVSTGQALLIDTLLLALFALQHSIMARPAFKAAWTRIVPEEAERSTYVLFSSAALLLVFWKWEPIGGLIWSFESTAAILAMRAIFVLGMAIILASTFLINHFDLFGLRQVYLNLVGEPYTKLQFGTPFFYRYVRHPLYLGWLLYFWATPVMTVAHLFFAAMCTAYILIAIRFEERDLETLHGDEYRAYKNRVPMILPVKSSVGRPNPAGGRTRLWGARPTH